MTNLKTLKLTGNKPQLDFFFLTELAGSLFTLLSSFFLITILEIECNSWFWIDRMPSNLKVEFVDEKLINEFKKSSIFDYSGRIPPGIQLQFFGFFCFVFDFKFQCLQNQNQNQKIL